MHLWVLSPLLLNEVKGINSVPLTALLKWLSSSSSNSSSVGGSPKLPAISAALFWRTFKFHWFSLVLVFLTELSALKNACLEKQNHLWLQNCLKLFFEKICEDFSLSVVSGSGLLLASSFARIFLDSVLILKGGNYRMFLVTGLRLQKGWNGW